MTGSSPAPASAHRRLKLQDLMPFVYGGVASCVAEAATFPIDTAKTRLQLQGESGASKKSLNLRIGLRIVLRACLRQSHREHSSGQSGFVRSESEMTFRTSTVGLFH